MGITTGDRVRHARTGHEYVVLYVGTLDAAQGPCEVFGPAAGLLALAACEWDKKPCVVYRPCPGGEVRVRRLLAFGDTPNAGAGPGPDCRVAVYQRDSAPGSCGELWVRPVGEFSDPVETAGGTRPRFEALRG